MELQNFLNSCQGDIRTELFNKYKIYVKEHNNICVIDCGNNQSTEPIIRQSNGTFVNKNTKKIIHYFDERSLLSPIIEPNETIVTRKYTEGSLIKIYYNGKRWRIGTSKQPFGKLSIYNGVCFEELFRDIVDFEKLTSEFSKRYCYTYLLRHEAINAVYEVEKNEAIFINKVDLETFEVIYNEDLKVDNDYQGDKIVYFGRSNTKVMTDEYKLIKSLNIKDKRDLRYVYLSHLNDATTLSIIKNVFKSENFNYMDDLFERLMNVVYNAYREHYIRKSSVIYYCNREFTKLLRQLHNDYRTTQRMVTLKSVKDLLMDTSPYILEELFEVISNIN
jgi:hypothetical protein